MMLKNSPSHYGVVAKSFHWLMFLIIAGLVILGLSFEDMEKGPDKIWWIGVHKAFGIVVLILVLLRLSWKLANAAPLLPHTLSPLEKKLAHAGHAALYALMFAMPISGWLISSAAGYPVSVFGWFTMPSLVAPDKDMAHFFEETHEFFANALIAMVSLHVLAALLHHFYHHNNVLRRMLPWGEKSEHAEDTATGC